MQPTITVGILFAPSIHFFLSGEFECSAVEKTISGPVIVEKSSEGTAMLAFDDESLEIQLPVSFQPKDPDKASFDLMDVTIGINFHWERKENQRFTGSLNIIDEGKHLTAINQLPLEDYLKSVISSEMSATSSPELLKAHAVVSRSWLLAQIEKGETLKKTVKQISGHDTDDEHIRWYDREDHENFHVCADDHCQRYQGITKTTTNDVAKAIDETFGQVLTYNNQICDARYSKCCGGITEVFENVWEPVYHPYLAKVIDNEKAPEGFDTELDTEDRVHHWVTGNPDAFCNTTDKEILAQVLNDYDQETPDFYRWKKEFTQQELTSLLKKRLDISVGAIKELVPVERGTSGRLIKLKIVGTEKAITIGKELEIRKAFSDSHLYSSAFVVESKNSLEGIPQNFTFRGAGWGHGVGFCQIGAAVMGAKNYSYIEILTHYFRGAELERKY